MEEPADVPKWRAEGLLFENCSCQVICPAHVSFKQNCTHERCTGHWAIHVEQGAFGHVALDGLSALIVFDTPQQMYSGNWTEGLYIDERADSRQREALEMILKGLVGGPWVVLAKFVKTWLQTRFVPFELEDGGRHKRLRIDGLFETSVDALRGADGQREVLLENLFNQIHGPTHVLARGSTRYSDSGLTIDTNGTHALYSHFRWEGP